MGNTTFSSLQRHLSGRKRQLRAKVTLHENHIRTLLDALEVRYIFQKGFICRGMQIVDFYLPKPWRIAIEIDGPNHYQAKQKAKDEERDRLLKTFRKTDTIRISNPSAIELTSGQLLSLLTATKEARQPRGQRIVKYGQQDNAR